MSAIVNKMVMCQSTRLSKFENLSCCPFFPVSPVLKMIWNYISLCAGEPMSGSLNSSTVGATPALHCHATAFWQKCKQRASGGRRFRHRFHHMSFSLMQCSSTQSEVRLIWCSEVLRVSAQKKGSPEGNLLVFLQGDYTACHGILKPEHGQLSFALQLRSFITDHRWSFIHVSLKRGKLSCVLLIHIACR